ncbi:MAG: 2-hydroxyacid dehydrogenase [Thermovirgaceae bacterium]
MNILFGGKAFEKLLPHFRPLLEGHKLSVAASADDLPELVKDTEILVTGPMPVTEELLAKAPRLKLVQQWGVGVETIDIDACSKRNVLVANVPSRGTGNAEGVAEIAVLHLLILARRYGKAVQNISKKRLYSPQGISLWGKKAVVIGLGNVGQCIVERLRGFGMRLAGVNRTRRREHEKMGIDLYGLDDVERALKGSRFILLSLELNESTRSFADKKFFSFFPEKSFFVNVGRAGLVERPALERALERGVLAGVGMDVFWDEPADPEDPLLSNPQVVVTPHIGGITDAAFEKITSFVVENIKNIALGERPKSLLNPEVLKGTCS